MEKWTDTDYYDQQVRKLQLPFVPAVSATATAQSLEQQQQRRRENVKRLIEINARKREERVSQASSWIFLLPDFDLKTGIIPSKLASDEERLETLQIVRQQLSEVDDVLVGKLLKEVGLSDEQQLEQEIQIVQDRISKTRLKMSAATSSTQASELGEVITGEEMYHQKYIFQRKIIFVQ